MTLWLTKHSAFKVERNCSTICLSLGWNRAQNIVFANLLVWNLMFMWSVRPGCCSRDCWRPLNAVCGRARCS